MITAIPTKYRDVVFRSRLEARWAAMFDLLGWKWNYEPFDLSGWIPDFMLNSLVLVEIKPFTSEDEFASEILTIRRAIKGVWCKPVLLLGVDPFREIDGMSEDFPAFGFLVFPDGHYGEATESFGERVDDTAVCVTQSNKHDLTEYWGTWGSMLGVLEFHKWYVTDDDIEEIRSKWATACNTTKWNARKELR